MEDSGPGGVGLLAAMPSAAQRAPEAAHGTAGVLAPQGAPQGALPCGTGWPDGSRHGTGWPPGPSSPARAPERSEAGPAPRRERSCALAGQLGSVAQARDFARATVRGWGLPELCEDVTSVISELVTNALRYGVAEAGTRPAAQVGLRLLLRAADVICMVADPGAGAPELAHPGRYAEGGRGLLVVASCSDRWGWDPLAGGGKVVWAAFHLRPSLCGAGFRLPRY